jgi:hypothetical protein
MKEDFVNYWTNTSTACLERWKILAGNIQLVEFYVYTLINY